MNDFIDSFNHTGEVLFRGNNIYQNDLDVTDFRREVGMVFKSQTLSQALSTKTSLGVQRLMATKETMMNL